MKKLSTILAGSFLGLCLIAGSAFAGGVTFEGTRTSKSGNLYNMRVEKSTWTNGKPMMVRKIVQRIESIENPMPYVTMTVTERYTKTGKLSSRKIEKSPMMDGMGAGYHKEVWMSKFKSTKDGEIRTGTDYLKKTSTPNLTGRTVRWY